MKTTIDSQVNIPTATTTTSPFLQACGRIQAPYTPVWFMRQAGRYMPEYRLIREKYSMLEICTHPELAAQVTMQPVRALDVDAAILFADILLPTIPMGLGLEFSRNEGPIFRHPISSIQDVIALHTVDPEADLSYVLDTIRILRGELGSIPLIGFCGAPFTVASYLIEGGASRDFIKTKSLMYNSPDIWRILMEKLSIVLADYIVAQIKAGVQAVQVFDSWVGALTPQDYETYVLSYSQKIFCAVNNLGIPSIHFGTNTAMLLPLMKQAGGDVIGLDWRIPLDEGWQVLGEDVGIQGNLDPAILFAPIDFIQIRVQDILDRAGNRPGHIFNLGHGILQNTPVASVKAVVEMVHSYGH